MIEYNWGSQTCLVTGGSGFGGSHLCEKLLTLGARVIVIDRWLPKDSYLVLSGNDKYVHYIQGDIKDLELLKTILDRFQVDIVFHLAAQPIVPFSNTSPYETLATNAMGTYAVLEAIRTAYQQPRLVFASSGAYYGTTSTATPIKEEDTPLPATNIYGPSKVAGDIVVRSFAKTFGIKAAVCRFMNTYGPGDTNFSRLVPRALFNLFNNPAGPYDFGDRDDGTTKLDFLYIADMAEAYIAVAEHLDDLEADAVNVGTGTLHSIQEIANSVSRLFDGEPRQAIFSGEPKTTIISKCLDNTKITQLTNWTPKTSPEDGIRKSIDWYREHWKQL